MKDQDSGSPVPTEGQLSATDTAALVRDALNGPSRHACGLCSGHGFYGSPGQRCTFCNGTGELQAWPPAAEPIASPSPTPKAKYD